MFEESVFQTFYTVLTWFFITAKISESLGIENSLRVLRFVLFSHHFLPNERVLCDWSTVSSQFGWNQCRETSFWNWYHKTMLHYVRLYAFSKMSKESFLLGFAFFIASLQPFKPQYPHTNPPDWFPYIFLCNRDFKIQGRERLRLRDFI